METRIYEVVVEPGKEICDFCSSRDIEWQYPADDGLIEDTWPPNLIRESIGDWAACEVCSELIETNKRFDLMLRSAESNLKSSPEYTFAMAGFVADEVCKVHKVFWEKKKGSRIKIERRKI
uniref:Uncharacterized protein n=1 Tax=viral metagenome TaxID=1070528 RepID=A0A6M3KXQ8_9ZZZZ